MTKEKIDNILCDELDNLLWDAMIGLIYTLSKVAHLEETSQTRSAKDTLERLEEYFGVSNF